MPPNNATIIVTFHGDYEGRLTLVDLSQADRTAQATMFEDSGVAPDPDRQHDQERQLRQQAGDRPAESER